jgi:hypothetical protein
MSIFVLALAGWLVFNLAIVTALYLKPLRTRFRQWPRRNSLALARYRQRTF